MEFYTQFKRPPKYLEVHEDEGLVDKEGVLSTENLVGQFLDMGERIQTTRMYMFDNPEDVPDDFPGDHPMDVLDAMLAAKNHMTRVKQSAERRAMEEAAKETAKVVPEPPST